MFLTTGGETRKFYRNMQFNRSARQLGVIGLQLAACFAPLLVIAFVGLALYGAFTGHDVLQHLFSHGHGVLAAAAAPVFTSEGLGKARALREERAKLLTEAQKLIPDKGRMTAEVRAKYDAMIKDVDDMISDINRIEQAEARMAEMVGSRKPPESVIPGGDAAEVRKAKEKRWSQVFWKAMKGGDDERLVSKGIPALTSEERAILHDAEYRDMATGGNSIAAGGTGGNIFVPYGFVNEVEQALKYYGPMLRVSRIMRTETGQPLPFPTSNDTSVVGELVGEGSQVTTNDVTLGAIVLGAYKYSTKMVKVSVELLQDSAFDLDSFLKEQFAIRLGRILNTHFTTGSGTAQPKGIITAATSGGTAAGSSTNDGGAGTGANSIGTDDLVTLEHSVDPLYRPGARWQANDSTIKALKQLKDKYGRPIWLPGLAVNAEDSILGYPYDINNDMDAIATGKKTVLFGQMQKYVVRQVKELSIMRLVERFADFGQVAFIGFARYDGNLIDAGTNPVKFLTQA